MTIPLTTVLTGLVVYLVIGAILGEIMLWSDRKNGTKTSGSIYLIIVLLAPGFFLPYVLIKAVVKVVRK